MIFFVCSGEKQVTPDRQSIADGARSGSGLEPLAIHVFLRILDQKSSHVSIHVVIAVRGSAYRYHAIVGTTVPRCQRL